MVRGLIIGLRALLALAVLGLGGLVIAPAFTATWPAASTLQPIITHAVATTPLDRGPWGVLVLALGVALLLAAWPKPVADPSRRRTAQTVKAGSLVSEPATIVPDVPPESEPVLDPVPAAALGPPGGLISSTAQPATTAVEAAPLLTDPESQTAPELSEGGDRAAHDAAVAQARMALIGDAGIAARSHLADLLKKSGDIFDAEGRYPEAIAAYEESAGLRRTIALGRPDDGREQRWLWITLDALAECVALRGRRGRAADLYREAVSAGARAVALAPNEGGYAKELVDTQTRLAALDAQLST